MRVNGIAAAEESCDLAAICLLVGLKVENDTPNSCGKHFRQRVFASAKHSEVQLKQGCINNYFSTASRYSEHNIFEFGIVLVEGHFEKVV